MPSPLFYLFALLMVAGGLMVVLMRNPVSSALSMVLSFIGIAGLFIGLNSYFVGILQILVYAGAIMVLFIFIIMLLDVKKEEKTGWKNSTLAVGVAIPTVLLIQLAGVLSTAQSSSVPEIDFKQALEQRDTDGELTYKEGTIIRKRLTEGRLPDTHLIGKKLFTDYNFPLQVIAVLLLVATVGCVTLSKKTSALPVKQTPPTPAPQESLSMVKNQSKPNLPKAKVEVAPTRPENHKIVEKSPTPKNSKRDANRGLIYTQRPDGADDLKIISGVGPKLEQKLNEFGIYTFDQIANWSEENVTEFDDLLSFKGRITRDNWLTQAAELAAKKNA